MNQSEINFRNGAEKTTWSEELEGVPLKQRLKLLLASNRISVDSDLKLASNRISVDSDLKLANVNGSGRALFPTIVKHGGVGEFNDKDIGSLEDKCLHSGHGIAAVSDKVSSVDISSHQESVVAQNPVKVKVECADICVESSLAKCTNAASLTGIQASKSEPEMTEEFLDELDHVVLKERLRRLLTSKSLGLSSMGLEETSPEEVKADPRFGNQKHVVLGNQVHENDKTFKSGTSNGTMNSFYKLPQTLGNCSQGSGYLHPGSLGIQRNETDSRKALLADDIRAVQTSAIPTLANIKLEPANYNFQSSNETTLGPMPNFVPMKSEVHTSADAYEDELDHMLLRERMKLLSSRDGPNSDIHQNSKCVSKLVPSASSCRPVGSKPAESLKINRPRKRRKTITDSVETAMEEDAPGLLQVLIEKGVSVNEIKLYGEPESNDALDDLSMKDSFAELEEVITKLFTQRDSLLKLGPLRCTKGEKTSYCLDCLFSLVEQAHYLQFRQWPVEWGWCRDLQSFIFVFERHNRIVLERPEYGYATYFFELEDSLPINWQIKRLVIAMKLTSCSRITLIENKALMVGDDLTEGEARVLMEYGWLPNTGLGTMLNYYDRVVHDRRFAKDSSEWRSKIGKLLMDGYNGGTIIPSYIPRKVTEYNAEQALQVKLELS